MVHHATRNRFHVTTCCAHAADHAPAAAVPSLLLLPLQMVLSKIRNAARTLLTMEDKDPKRIFEGTALMRRMYK